jgi:predicted lipoprotein with Yx(FWY)xxD motif
MRRLLTFAVLAATLTLAACGSSNGGSGAAASAGAPRATVGVKNVSGLGDVLVDSGGLALYAADQESRGKIHCTGGCTSFWHPLTAGPGKPRAAHGAGRLDVIRRPDGTRQVAMDGKPLYTFVQDSPGNITGDGFRDEFGGESFTWHVVLAGGGRSDGGTARGGYGY